MTGHTFRVAEITLRFGAGGLPYGTELHKLRLREHDTVLCTLDCRYGPDMIEAVGRQLRELVTERGLKDVQVIITVAGVELTTLSAEELADLGLQRIG